MVVELGALQANSGSSIEFLLTLPQMGIFICAFLPH